MKRNPGENLHQKTDVACLAHLSDYYSFITDNGILNERIFGGQRT